MKGLVLIGTVIQALAIVGLSYVVRAQRAELAAGTAALRHARGALDAAEAALEADIVVIAGEARALARCEAGRVGRAVAR